MGQKHGEQIKVLKEIEKVFNTDTLVVFSMPSVQIVAEMALSGLLNIGLAQIPH